MKAVMIAAVLAILHLTACGGSEESILETGKGKGRILANGNIDCDGTTCNSSAQYCLLTLASDKVTSSGCVNWPAGQKDCASAQKNARTRRGECDINYGSWSGSCVQANESTIVTCGS